MSGQVRRQLGQVVERADPDPLEEVAGGPVEVRAGLVVLARLLDQPAGEQGAHHAVDVDAADRRDPGARDRLLVGDDRQGLQRRLGEPRLLPLEDEPLDDARRTPRACRTASRRRRCAARSRAPAAVYSSARPCERGARPPRPGSPPRSRARPRRAAGRPPSARPPARAAARPPAPTGSPRSRSAGPSRSWSPPGRHGWARRPAPRRGSGGAPSNSSISNSSSSLPVHRTVSSPSGVTWSNDDRPLAEELEQREEPRDGGQRVGRVTAQRPEGHRPRPAQPLDHQGRLLAHADLRGVDVLERDLEHRLGLHRPGGQRRELLQPDADQHLGQQGGEALLEPDRPRVPLRLLRQPGCRGRRRPA